MKRIFNANLWARVSKAERMRLLRYSYSIEARKMAWIARKHPKA